MIPLFKVFMADEAGHEMLETLYSGYITQGPIVDEFEEKLEKFLKTDNVVTVNSGTSALQLAVRLAKGPPDVSAKVISTPMTCTATNTAILATGASILWADIDLATGNIDPESVERLLRKYAHYNIKAIMGVDWAGHPCDWRALNALAEKYGVATIEDAAHAFGSVDPNNCGHYVCYSFQAIKPLTTIDGGALVLNRHYVYREAKLLRWFGIDRETPQKDFRCSVDIPNAGYKYHMNDVNASVGISNLRYMEGILSKHRRNAKILDKYLQQARYGSARRLVKVGTSEEYAPWVFTLRTDVGLREEFVEYMKVKGIVVGQVHTRNDRMTSFRYPYIEAQDGTLPNLNLFSKTQVNIPCGWWVTKKEARHIGTSLEEYCLRGVPA